jgi:quercetin dioxygenase-like cupin family protein
MAGGTKRLRGGNVIVLPARQRHALRARADSAVLVTLRLDDGDAGKQGGTGNQRLDEAERAGS